MAQSILDLLKERKILLDGGFGTELIKDGFPQGTCPESWNEEKPNIVQKIHKSYYDAGSDAVLTNSFGGTTIKLQSHNLEKRCYDLNRTAAAIANEVKPEGKFLGGSMGPTGKFLKPHGEFSEAQFEDAYAEQARGLTDGQVDFLLIETQYDLNEALCALRGARKASDLPIFVTMTFNHHPKGFFTLMGNTVGQFLETMEKEGVSVVGSNCTLNSEEMVELVRIMREKTSLPIIAQANAGKPSLSEEGEVAYSQGMEDYLRFIPQIITNGADIIGGCCGTDPDYIALMSEIVKRSS
ncbi:MAG: homocysteine S-methyltransferase family protein [Candidatus Aminicenantes bacterium]|nr:homocysteine S-methyltransferase family protein [Candidatus Aminicenantes bacterium]